MICIMMNLKPALSLQILALIALSRFAYCSLLLPEQFHSTTELWFFHRDLNFDDTFFVDEYVDRPNWRSSLRLTNNRGLDVIYYNELFGKKDGSIERKFVQFNPIKLTCTKQGVYGWYLDQVRKLSIGIMAMDHVSSKNVDIAIGTSGLLYAVESRMDELKYRGSVFDGSRLIAVDVFELFVPRPFGFVYNSGKDLLLQVSIMTPDEQVLADKEMIFGRSLGEVAKLMKYKLTIVSVKVCSVNTVKVRQHKDSNDKRPYECRVDIADGQEQDLFASIDLIEDLINDSLLGQPLEKMSQFDFDANPFAQPAGLGCGQQTRTNSLAFAATGNTFKAQANQFSGEYFSLNGSQGLSFVAFDGQRQVIRHDREGRKNVYDLGQGRSYHLDHFRSVRSIFDDSLTTNCVQLEIGSDMLLMDDRVSVMARLLGIDHFDEANYIGSRTINGETFSVYELELAQDKNAPGSYNLPILIEPIGFAMPKVDGQSSTRRLRYFITYYVLEIPDFGEPEVDTIKIPRLMELWELIEYSSSRSSDVTERKRSLINVLEFTQFSWSLNIQPEEELGDNNLFAGYDLSRLFSLDSCRQERSEQLLLTFSTIYSSLSTDLIQANKVMIRENFHQQLAGVLDIPRLNLISLDFHFSPTYTGWWFFEAKLAELVQGSGQDELLGLVQYNTSSGWLLNSDTKLDLNLNRHSLDQCRLDSLALKQPNSIVFCPGLTLCLLLDPAAIEAHLGDLFTEQTHDGQVLSSEETMAICEVRRFSWRPIPLSRQDGRAILPRVLENRKRIISNSFAVDLVQADQKQKPVKYSGFGHNVKVQPLDDTLSLGSDRPPLTGLRYLAAAEGDPSKPEANSNYAYKLFTNQLGDSSSVFRECHMACQMDEYCESFSICKQTGRANDTGKNCILSTMRLSRDKLADLEVLLKNPDGDELSIRVGSESSSFVVGSDDNYLTTYKFHRDSGCSLHPKDILAQFRPTKTLELPIDLNSDDRDLMTTAGVDVVSVAECAGIANEIALMEQNSLDVEFVYCPVESLCLSQEQSVKAKQQLFSEGKSAYNSSNGIKVEKCIVYTKSHIFNFYDYTLYRKLELKFNGSHEALEDDSVQKINRVIEGLSLEQCARDCNLQQSNCLAFDVCEFETNITICTLFSIRSPLSPKTKLGYLPEEQMFYANDSSLYTATVVENRKCAHFHLKDSYFKLKINHVMESDTRIQRSRLNQLEDKILELDKRASDKMMIESILGSNNRSEDKSSQEQHRRQVSGSSSGLLIHLALIISGSVLGAIGYLYSKEGFTFAVDTVEYLRARRGKRFADHRISQLDLASHQDL